VNSEARELLDFAQDMMLYIQGLEMESSETVHDGLRIKNTDGSVTLKMTNKNNIITRPDEIIIFIAANEDITIRTQNAIIEINKSQEIERISTS